MHARFCQFVFVWPVFDGNELKVFNLDEYVENSGKAGFELNRIWSINDWISFAHFCKFLFKKN